jgi:hypothetical protein
MVPAGHTSKLGEALARASRGDRRHSCRRKVTGMGRGYVMRKFLIAVALLIAVGSLQKFREFPAISLTAKGNSRSNDSGLLAASVPGRS